MVVHVSNSTSREMRFSENAESIASERSPLLRALRDDSYSFEGTYMSIPPSSTGGISEELQFRPIIYAEKALASLLNGVLLYACCCMLGFFLVSLNFEQLLGETQINWWIIFSPFWLANIILFGAHMTSIRHAKLLRQWAEVESMSNEPLLPLLRRIVLIYAISFPLMFLLLWSEVAFCAKLAHLGTIHNFYICFTPLMVIQVAFCIRYFLCRSNSTLPGFCWMLVFLFTLLLAYQLNGQHVVSIYQQETNQHYRKTVFALSWWIVLTPLFALEFLMFCALIVILHHEFAGIYRLTRWQLSASAFYALSVISSVTGQVMVLEHFNHHWGTLTFPSILLFIGFICGSLALYIVGQHHVQALMATKGGAVPIPLTKTNQGWITNHAIRDYWILFGDISFTIDGLNTRNQQHYGRRSSMNDIQQIPLWKRVWRLIRRNRRQDGLEERESYQQSLVRRTSGSYSDIKIDYTVETPTKRVR